MLAIRIFAGIMLAAFCWQLFQAFRFQEFRRGERITSMREKPFLFWLSVVSHFPLMVAYIAIVLFLR